MSNNAGFFSRIYLVSKALRFPHELSRWYGRKDAGNRLPMKLGNILMQYAVYISEVKLWLKGGVKYAVEVTQGSSKRIISSVSPADSSSLSFRLLPHYWETHYQWYIYICITWSLSFFTHEEINDSCWPTIYTIDRRSIESRTLNSLLAYQSYRSSQDLSLS